MDDIINLIPEPIRSHYGGLLAASLIVGRAIQSIRTNGGLKAMFASIWLGTNGDPKLRADIEALKSATGVITK